MSDIACRLAVGLVSFFSLGVAFVGSATAQKFTIETPVVAHQGVPFDVRVRSERESALDENSLKLVVGRQTIDLVSEPDGNLIGRNVSSSAIGKIRFALLRDETELAAQEINVIPGWVSVVPPLLAILIALITRNVVPAIFLGIWFGAYSLNGFSFAGAFTGLLDAFQVFVLSALADSDHAAIILFSLMIGGMVGIISENGGMRGIVQIIERWTRTPRTGQASTGLLGLIIFFDDYANVLVVGNTMRRITDRLKISREKLAYIVDSTAAPVSCIAFVTTWIGFEVGLVGDAIEKIDGFEMSAYSVFLASIPYSFYPILAIALVFLIAASGRDFGPMFRAEQRARTTGQLWAVTAQIEHDDQPSAADAESAAPQRAINAVLPVIVLVAGVIVGLYATGVDPEDSEQSIRDIIGNADSYKALMWASLLAVLTAAVLTLAQRLLTLGETVDAWYRGGRSMGFAMVILVLAWSLSAVSEQLQTADFLVSAIGDRFPAAVLPAVVFIMSAAIAFATGTSWGTMGILIPLVMPLSWAVLTSSGGDPNASLHIVYSSVACVLAGAVAGDHCSPISDTTILSSMASGCDHVDHVRTQLPYAILVGAVGLLLGTLPAGFGLPIWVVLPVCLVVLMVVHRLISRPVPAATFSNPGETPATKA